VADTGISHREDGPRHIRVFDVGADGGTLRGGEVFAACEAGVFDGFRVDTEGRLWTRTAEGVHCYLPSGDLIGKIRIPEVVANCTFGGVKKNRLFICGTTSLYSIFVNANGAQRP
jgi:gluconolactonase